MKTHIMLIAFLVFLAGGQFSASLALADELNVIGTVEPASIVEVTSRVDGVIRSFGTDPNNKNKPFDFNSVVGKGDVLAELDTAPFELARLRAQADLNLAVASLESAKAKLKIAQLSLDKVRKSAGEDVAQAELDLARADIDVGRARVNQCKISFAAAEADLESCKIRAPIAGVILDRRLDVGQTVSSKGNSNGTSPAPFLMMDLSKTQIWVQVDESKIDSIAEGQNVKITYKSGRKGAWSGRVSKIRQNASSPKSDVVFTVVIDVDPGDGAQPRPFFTVNVAFDLFHP